MTSNPNQYHLSPFTTITRTASRTPRWALMGPANTPYPLIGSIKKRVDRVHDSGLGDPFSDLILGDAIWAQSIVAYRELQKTQYSLGARGGVPDWNTANTLQGNGQSTQPIPTRSIPSSFRIFQANFLALFPGQ